MVALHYSEPPADMTRAACHASPQRRDDRSAVDCLIDSGAELFSEEAVPANGRKTGEMQSLEVSSVQCIGLASIADAAKYTETILAQSGSSTRGNGSTGQLFILAQNNFVRSFAPIAVSAEAIVLPDLGGSGWVRGPREAAAQSLELIGSLGQARDAGAVRRRGRDPRARGTHRVDSAEMQIGAFVPLSSRVQAGSVMALEQSEPHADMTRAVCLAMHVSPQGVKHRSAVDRPSESGAGTFGDAAVPADGKEAADGFAAPAGFEGKSEYCNS